MKKSALPTKSPRTSQESVEDRWDDDDWYRTDPIEKDFSIEDVRRKDIVASDNRDENTMTLAERSKRFRSAHRFVHKHTPEVSTTLPNRRHPELSLAMTLRPRSAPSPSNTADQSGWYSDEVKKTQ